jgi:D-psicose/D-tagatose/L-ribulose 3-epimerase
MILFGINTFLWASPFRTTDLPLLERAGAFGFDLVEIPIEGLQDLDYVKAAEAFRRTGLRCSICGVMGPGRDPSHEDQGIQEGGVAYLKHLIDAAVTMKAVVVAGPHYSAVGRTWQATPDQRRRDLERCAGNLKR